MNTKEIYYDGHMYRVTRRIIQRKRSTVLRVRVNVWEGFTTSGPAKRSVFKDYRSIAEGDAVFYGHIDKLSVYK